MAKNGVALPDGTFPIPDQPDGRPHTELPQHLLARLAVSAPVAVRSGAPTTDAAAPPTAEQACAARQCSGDAAVEHLPTSVGVAPLGNFLTRDPSLEGPFPGEARNLVRRSGHGRGDAASVASAKSAARLSHASPAGSDRISYHDDAARPGASCAHCNDHGASKQGDVYSVMKMTVDQGSCEAGSDQDAACRSGQHTGPVCWCSDIDTWQPFWLPDAELTARGAVMDIVTVRPVIAAELPVPEV